MRVRLTDVEAINQAVKHFTENGKLDINRVLCERRWIEVFMPSSLVDAPVRRPEHSEFDAVKQIENAMITLDSYGNVVVDFPESSFKKE